MYMYYCQFWMINVAGQYFILFLNISTEEKGNRLWEYFLIISKNKIYTKNTDLSSCIFMKANSKSRFVSAHGNMMLILIVKSLPHGENNFG